MIYTAELRTFCQEIYQRACGQAFIAKLPFRKEKGVDNTFLFMQTKKEKI